MAERTFHAGHKNGNKLWKMPGCWGGGNNGLSWQVFAKLNNQTQNTTCAWALSRFGSLHCWKEKAPIETTNIAATENVGSLSLG